MMRRMSSGPLAGWLDVETPTTLSQLAGRIVADVAAAPFRAAPERADELRELASGLVLRVSDGAAWKCETIFTAVLLSAGTLEAALLATHAYLAFYTEFVAGRAPNAERVDLPATGAMRTIRAALIRTQQIFAGQLDAEVAVEVDHPGTALAARELALLAIGMFLLHELGHVVEDSGLEGVDAEVAADTFASNWVLARGAELSGPVRRKRALGAAVGYLLISASGFANGHRTGLDHPLPYDRLIDVLGPHVPLADDEVWGFVVGILVLYMTNAGIEVPTTPFDTFGECALALRDTLRRATEKSGS